MAARTGFAGQLEVSPCAGMEGRVWSGPNAGWGGGNDGKGGEEVINY